MSHTPGPWTATEPHKWVSGRYKCSVRYGRIQLGNSLAEVYLGGDGALRCDADSVLANARLIAAAPELLEALEHMVAVSNWATTIQSEEQYDAMIATAEAAIRKAKGGL